MVGDFSEALRAYDESLRVEANDVTVRMTLRGMHVPHPFLSRLKTIIYIGVYY
jgi:hypothetical protein